MSRVRANCPDCGDVEFDIDQICVLPGQGQYRFICPMCVRQVRREAPRAIVDILLAHGCLVVGEDPITEREIERFGGELASTESTLYWSELGCE